MILESLFLLQILVLVHVLSNNNVTTSWNMFANIPTFHIVFDVHILTFSADTFFDVIIVFYVLHSLVSLLFGVKFHVFLSHMSLNATPGHLKVYLSWLGLRFVLYHHHHRRFSSSSPLTLVYPRRQDHLHFQDGYLTPNTANKRP